MPRQLSSKGGPIPGNVQGASISVDSLVLLASAYWILACNRPLLAAALRGRPLESPATWVLLAALVGAVAALHVVLLALLCNRWTAKPVLMSLTLVAAVAAFYAQKFGVYLDPSMLSNVLHSDPAEAGELITARLALNVALYAGPPLLLLSRVRILRTPWRYALKRRMLLIGGAALVMALSVLAAFQPLASMLRNHRELRYLITPANVVWSLAKVSTAGLRSAAQARVPIGADAVPGPSWLLRRKPLVVVLVIGETARAANWGLSGYRRQTTPQLADLPVVNFAHVTSCGTSTEVSLPCMFSRTGRRAYDEARIRREESLLHLLSRVGVAVHWRDGQSGCKGVCDGLPQEHTAQLDGGRACQGGHCLDERLVSDLNKRLERLTSAAVPTTEVWVLHMLGEHGPSYFRRRPQDYAVFQPECRDDDLRDCSVESIVNAYDNAVLYTDHVLARAIRQLTARADEVDSAFIYVSDHGESLGERGFFLHGVPYAIAPEEQKRVPMLFWSSLGFERAAGLRAGCLSAEMQSQAVRPQAHDNLFHTVLGLLDVRSAIYEPGLDLVSACRGSAKVAE